MPTLTAKGTYFCS